MTKTIARTCAHHPWLTIAVWIALAVVAIPLSARFLDSSLTTETYALGGGIESERASSLLEDRLRGPETITELVIVQSPSLSVDTPAFQEEVESIFHEITALGRDVVSTARHYYQENDESLVSEDRDTTYIAIVMAGDLREAEANVEHVLDIVAEANATGDFRVLVGGAASISYESNEFAERDLRRGESIGVPVALIVLLVLFGTVVAALMPLGLAVVAIVISIGVVSVVGQIFQMVFFVQMIIIMIGLAVGIDYSLFIISRFRQEMGNGLSPREAVTRAGATEGRSVLFSGVIVVLSLLGLLFVPSLFFRSQGFGAIVVVILAVMASLTLLPAVLTLLGPRINYLPLPFIGSRNAATPSADETNHGFWAAATRITTRHPIISILIVGVPMLAVSAFYFQIQTGLNGVDSFPADSQTREAFFVLEEEFSFGLITPVEIVIDGDLQSSRVREGIEKLEAALQESPDFPLPPADLEINREGDLALLTVAVHGEPRSPGAVAIVNVLRDRIIPDAFTGVPADVYVGGVTANSADLFDIVDRYTPIVFTFVLGLSFILLLVVFRSIVIAAKAVIMNLLSVGAAYGLMVLVFQTSLADVLPFFHKTEVIDAWIPLMLFCILFGLSMDYHVFLLSRIRERYERTQDNTQAVAYGLHSTAGLITGAALIMVVVFGGFASGKTVINQQVGFGLAAAIFLDATLVRSILVPATMAVLGKRNWYLPSFLNWLPNWGLEATEENSVREDPGSVHLR